MKAPSAKPAWTSAFFAAALMIAVIPCASAAEPVDPGRRIAEQRCSGCHAIGENDSSPNLRAPPLRTLNVRYPIDALRPAFLEGMEVGHRDMPRFVLEPQEVTDLLSYLRSLDPCGKPSSDKSAMAKCFAPLKP
jgi:mono/diheme cytochrome c family protein